MTDKDKLVALLTDFGVEFKFNRPCYENGNLLTCKAGAKKVSGYPGSFAEFEFDNSGKFIEVSVGE